MGPQGPRVRTGCSGPRTGALAAGTRPRPGSLSERRVAQPSRRYRGFEVSLWPREERCGRTGFLPHPLAAPSGCSLLAGDRFWEPAERRDCGFGLGSPESPPPQSLLLQVVDKNSRRVTRGEEQDSRKAGRRYDWSCKVGCGGGKMSPRSRERGLGVRGGADARPAESVRCETHGARNDRGAEHPAPRARRPGCGSRRFSPASRALEAGAGGAGRGSRSSARSAAGRGQRTWRHRAS